MEVNYVKEQQDLRLQMQFLNERVKELTDQKSYFELQAIKTEKEAEKQTNLVQILEKEILESKIMFINKDK